MRCHYEVLGVSQTATDDDLKKAYKKLALQWHPDKNPDQVVEAKKKFLEIRAAYEVLSDSRERSWYDAHRDVMLQKGFGDDYQDDTINIYPFFTSSCYQGYNDSENGFYTVYNKLFKDIAEQDFKASSDKTIEIPEFGNSESDYEEVVGPFYAYWSNYCTLRSYVWKEEHDTHDAADRRVRRLMEQENKKSRDKAKKERNEEVRELIAFVKKRDKRVQLRKIYLEEQATQKKKADTERRNREKQKKLEELAQYKESQWMPFEEFEKQLDDLEKTVKNNFQESNQIDNNNENDNEDSDDDLNELYCVACNKSFKSDKAFLNHENSRKHKELVQLMKAHIHEENEQLLLNNEDQMNITNNQDIVELPINNQTSKSKKKKKKQRRNNKDNALSDDETDEMKQELEEELLPKENNQEEDDTPPTESVSTSDKKKKTKPITEENNEISETAIILQCFICREEFSSRNALFKHIKELDHAKPIQVKTENKVKTKNKKK